MNFRFVEIVIRKPTLIKITMQSCYHLTESYWYQQRIYASETVVPWARSIVAIDFNLIYTKLGRDAVAWAKFQFLYCIYTKRISIFAMQWDNSPIQSQLLLLRWTLKPPWACNDIFSFIFNGFVLKTVDALLFSFRRVALLLRWAGNVALAISKWLKVYRVDYW